MIESSRILVKSFSFGNVMPTIAVYEKLFGEKYKSIKKNNFTTCK
jgi:hypothetical protein